MQLIHPIYLDVPMLVSFSAAIEGGFSLGSEVTRESESRKEGSITGATKFDLSHLFASLFSAGAEIEASGSASDKTQEVRREQRSHTEASIAILLYDKLKRNSTALNQPQTTNELMSVSPGRLIEVSGVIYKNAVDTLIDYLEAVGILMRFQATPNPQTQRNPQSNKGKSATVTQSPLSGMEEFRRILDDDRKRTPLSNALLRCTEPNGAKAIVTLRRANLRDLTLTELHKNNVRVVGKVTRVIAKGQTVSAFENYGLAMIKPDKLSTLFGSVATNESVDADFSDITVTGPAIQVLPLMIFV